MKNLTIREKLRKIPALKQINTAGKADKAIEAILNIVKDNGHVWTPLLRKRYNGLQKHREELLRNK